MFVVKRVLCNCSDTEWCQTYLTTRPFFIFKPLELV